MTTASRKVFEADLAKFDAAFRKADALITIVDDIEGPFTFIDQTRVSADLLRSYKRLVEYGYSTGLLS